MSERKKDKRIQLKNRAKKDIFVATMRIAGIAVRTIHLARTSTAHLHDVTRRGPMNLPACCMSTEDVSYSEGWDDDVEFCEKCWQITISRTDVVLFPKRVTHYVEGREDMAACGHWPTPVATIFTDEVTCPHCRVTDEWKKRALDRRSHYANYNFYYAAEVHDGKLPKGTLGDNGGHPTRFIFRTRKQLAGIPAEYFSLVRDCETINKAKLDLDCDPQAEENGWTYEPWNNGREILVEMSVQ